MQEFKVIYFCMNFVKIGIDNTKAVTTKRVDNRTRTILSKQTYFPVLFSLFTHYIASFYTGRHNDGAIMNESCST